MINIENIYKSFDNKQILKDISFSVDLGDKLAIIGQSGVGKSVLLKHLNGLLKPDSGKIWIDKLLVNNSSYQELQLIRKSMAMVFQFGALLDSMTISNNISLAIQNATNIKAEDIQGQINKYLELVDLPNIDNLFPSDISGGMKKRVGIARAIATNPKYILYDEPTTGLDPINADKINQLINKVSKKNTASIIVTHDINTVYNVANKVIMLYDGSIIFEGTPEELQMSNDKFIKYFTTGKQ